MAKGNRVTRGEEIVIARHNQPSPRIVPEARPPLAQVQKAVRDLDGLRQRMSERKGFKPISDKEIRNAIREDRR